ncbi:MAG: hypothetical protein J6A98_03965 [Clostridia bacterium]|nr:hypothetical protein [Clostridia bacterium]
MKLENWLNDYLDLIADSYEGLQEACREYDAAVKKLNNDVQEVTSKFHDAINFFENALNCDPNNIEVLREIVQQSNFFGTVTSNAFEKIENDIKVEQAFFKQIKLHQKVYKNTVSEISKYYKNAFFAHQDYIAGRVHKFLGEKLPIQQETWKEDYKKYNSTINALLKRMNRRQVSMFDKEGNCNNHLYCSCLSTLKANLTFFLGVKEEDIYTPGLSHIYEELLIPHQKSRAENFQTYNKVREESDLQQLVAELKGKKQEKENLEK